jgi:putative glycerol-1-phosphate prenyltransferase
MFALLIDPDKGDARSIVQRVKLAEGSGVDLIFVGGSLMMTDRLEAVLRLVRNNTKAPVLLFPGQSTQLNSQADALLLLSLISGRNADFLIGRHVQAAPDIRRSGLEVIPTGYILLESGRSTAVHYFSGTLPIPRDKPEIAAATAMAGEMLGLRMIYLEAGSGAPAPVPPDIIRAVKEAVKVPVIVGGGLREPAQLREVSGAGADVVVVGTAVEEHPEILPVLVAALRNSRSNAG